MNQSRLFCVAAAFAMVPIVASAQGLSYNQRFDIPVFPIDANTFEVVEARGAGGTQMWCAAGTYVREVLEQRDGALYILEGRGDSQALPGRKSVIFTTNAVPGAFSTVTQGVRRAGQLFSSGHAYALCRDTPHLRIKVSAG